MIYVGELEGRIKELASKLTGHNVVWLAPGFEEALFAGQHSRSPKGMLDALLPYVERGEITVVGELTPRRSRTCSRSALVSPEPSRSSAFARSTSPRSVGGRVEHVLDQVGVRASRTTLEESYDLAQQFLPGLARRGTS